MQLGFHGGKCCGIKVIHGLMDDPDDTTEALSKISDSDKDSMGMDVNSKERFFTDAAPEETYLKRLDRYIEYMRKRRPSHIIEITLAPFNPYCSQKAWIPLLRRRGFRCVTKAKNSNSGNEVWVFHKVILNGENA